ncbi:prolipoprotein diacylglyceryl transferase [Mycobacterium rufum]|uniref:Phosphatidylglycerol--prolipoprotein diacylglyceryl transferase n=1 Tax=Mycolicibacterium rufum TaxID=318424 RepID=A0A9X2YHM2_9MYCO|nr:prolipoprotein diacylglyceryl transferase [Mycolicibacterium rufum]
MTSTVLAYIPSPSQGVWHLGPFPLRAYALFIIAGIVAALVLGDRRWVARGGEPGVIYDIALWAVPFGLIGGRLYHVITDWRTYFGEDGAGFAAALRIWDGGLGIWGAVALGGIGAWIACRRRGIPLPAFGDAIAPGIILAQAIGRIGNYFNQELYGRETTLPWGLEIYERVNSAGVPDSLNGVSTGELIQVVHPTFLYELLWNLLVFAALLLIDRRFRIGHGRLFAMYVAGYCVGRFWIELMRSDAATHLAGIRVNSFTSTFVFIGAVVYVMVAPKGREDPASLRGKQDGEESRTEQVVKDLAVGATTSGVVAAATVAAADDEKSVAQAAEDDADETDVLVEREADLETVEGDEAVAPRRTAWSRMRAWGPTRATRPWTWSTVPPMRTPSWARRRPRRLSRSRTTRTGLLRSRVTTPLGRWRTKQRTRPTSARPVSDLSTSMRSRKPLMGPVRRTRWRLRVRLRRSFERGVGRRRGRTRR